MGEEDEREGVEEHCDCDRDRGFGGAGRMKFTFEVPAGP